jgi:hypothetical protein
MSELHCKAKLFFPKRHQAEESIQEVESHGI